VEDDGMVLVGCNGCWLLKLLSDQSAINMLLVLEEEGIVVFVELFVTGFNANNESRSFVGESGLEEAAMFRIVVVFVTGTEVSAAPKSNKSFSLVRVLEVLEADCGADDIVVRLSNKSMLLLAELDGACASTEWQTKSPKSPKSFSLVVSKAGFF
jgi:hypothetical protein